MQMKGTTHMHDVDHSIAEMVATLNECGGQATRTHIQKSIFLSSLLGLRDAPFEFVLYLYGPYSFELDDSIAEMVASGELMASAGVGGFGSRFSVSKIAAVESLKPLCRWLGAKGVRRLEAVSTVAYVAARGERDIVARVQRIKPHLGPEEIKAALEEWEQKRHELGVAQT